MKTQESIRARRYLILESLAASGSDLSFPDIRKLVKPRVSDPTLRADIRAIAQLPVVYKDSRGGLIARSRSIFDNTYFGDNLTVEVDNKDRIAYRLVSGDPPFEDSPLIDLHGDTLVIGPGTSTLAVLRVLAQFPSVEILTTNLGVLEIPDLMLKPSLHFSGGWVLSSVASLVGIAAVRNINAFGANIGVFGVSGLCVAAKGEPDVRLYCHHEAQLPVKKALIEDRQKVIVVACGGKLGKRDAFAFSSVSEILKESDLYIITDHVQAEIGEKVREQLKRLSQKSERHAAKLIELVEK